MIMGLYAAHSLAAGVLSLVAQQPLPDIDLTSVLMFTGLLAGIAFVIEAVVELIAAWWLKDVLPNEIYRANVLKLIASGIGVIFTVSYGLDIFAVLVSIYSKILNIQPTYPSIASWAGTVVTGLAIGRGAQWFHDIGKSKLGLDGG